jgi:hypothetical protein
MEMGLKQAARRTARKAATKKPKVFAGFIHDSLVVYPRRGNDKLRKPVPGNRTGIIPCGGMRLARHRDIVQRKNLD